MSKRWALFERFEIPDYDEPERNYMTRWRIISTPLFGLFLHRFDGPDSRPTLHDHPWSFLSIVLLGGYLERLEYGQQLRLVRRFNWKRANDFHYIDELTRTPTWTLFLVGRRSRTWGYRDTDGTWTAFDKHPHAHEFDAAMTARAELTAGS